MAAQAFLDAMDAKGMDKTKGTIGINMNVENEALNRPYPELPRLHGGQCA